MRFGFIDIHPIVKMIYFLLLLTFIMLTPHPLILLLYLIALSLYLIRLKGFLEFRKGLRFYLLLSLVLTLINPIFNQRGQTILFTLLNRYFTLEAVIYGLVMAMTFITIIILFQIFNETIDSHSFIYAIGRFGPKSAFLINMALRYIPLIQKRLKELFEIRSLTKSTKKLKQRIKLWGEIIGVIFTWSFEEAIITADSMESRGYGLKKRTSYLYFKWRAKDYLFLVLMFVLSFIISFYLIRGLISFEIYPKMTPLVVDRQNFLAYLAIALISSLPFFIDEKERLKWRNL